MLSTAIIVKNEEQMLAQCLDSLKGIDEIVICDTGSTDKTIEIAKQYTDKVFTDYVWQDDFAGARNHCIDKCTGDWILIIDADEHLEEGAIEQIKKELEGIDPKYDSLLFNVTSGRGQDAFYPPRVLRKDIRYAGKIHNAPLTITSKKTDIKLIFGYSPAHQLDPDRALRILKVVVDEDPNNARNLYYLAREYWYRKSYELAIMWFKRCLEKSVWSGERADAYLYLARCYWILKKGDDARTNCLNAILLNPNFKEAFMFMAQLVWEKSGKRWKEMAETCTNEDVLFIR